MNVSSKLHRFFIRFSAAFYALRFFKIELWPTREASFRTISIWKLNQQLVLKTSKNWEFIEKVSKIEFESSYRLSMLCDIITTDIWILFWYHFEMIWYHGGTILGAKINFKSILGASWRPWEHLGNTLGQSWGILDTGDAPWQPRGTFCRTSSTLR